MCRNIKTLANFEPPATNAEIHAAALQFVRKVSGTRTPSAANAEAFNGAVDNIAQIMDALLENWVARSPARNREVEADKARARNQRRFAGPVAT